MYEFLVWNLILNLDLTNLFLNVFSIIMPVILLFLTDNRNKKKEIFIKRCSVYVECFEILKEYKDNTFLAFNKNFISKLNEIHFNMIMLASRSVLDKYEQIYDKIKKINDNYYKEQNNIEGIFNSDELIEINGNYVTKDEYEERYMLEKCEKSESVEKYLIDLVDKMKKELKTDK